MRKYFKRIILLFGLMLVATAITLAFIPHYGCACAAQEGIVKHDGSWLSYIVRQITKKFMANPKRPRDANQLAIAYFQNRN